MSVAAASSPSSTESLKTLMKDVGFLRALVVLNGAIPLGMLAWDAWHGDLGANAVNHAIHITGILSLIFLFLSLIVTPLKQLTGWSTLVAYRRALGLYGFFYAVLHIAIYVVYDRALDLSSTLEELLTRRFLQIGAFAIFLMVPLAVTSTNAMITRLGPKRWKLLHRLAYVATALGVLHYYMLVKSDVRQPLAFAAVLTPLLGYRLGSHYYALRKAAAANPSVGTGPTAARKKKFWTGPLRVARIFQETPDVKTFRFVAPDGGELPFQHQAGQYLNIQLPINGQVVRRSYTIASSPTRHAYCEITVKREAMGTGSRFLHDHVHEGDLLTIGAPAGKFCFDRKEDHVVLIAGGVGITPMMSIARYLADTCWQGEIYLVVVIRQIEAWIFREELQQLQSRFPNLSLLVTLTGTAPSDWQGERGYLNAELLQRFIPNLATRIFFVCGPDPMMQATRTLLCELGVPETRILTEAFVSPASPANAANEALPNASSNDPVAAKSFSDATVSFSRSQTQVEVDGSITILEAAEDAGVELAYECRSGVCGQCKVRLLSGSVAMDSKDALSRSEEAAGLILACQSRPRSAEISIDA